jgi:hypothetical protein
LDLQHFIWDGGRLGIEAEILSHRLLASCLALSPLYSAASGFVSRSLGSLGMDIPCLSNRTDMTDNDEAL